MRLFDKSSMMTCTAGMAVLAALAVVASDASARAEPPPSIKNGDTLSGELLAMRSRAKGKRILTFQLTSGPYRIPGPDGLCNLETGPETFQLVTHSDSDVKELKPFIGKSISIKANEVTCAVAAGQITDALVTKWVLLKPK